MNPLSWTLLWLAAGAAALFLALAANGGHGRGRARQRLRRLALVAPGTPGEVEPGILRELRGAHAPLVIRIFERLRLLEPLRLLLYRAGQPIGLGRFLALSFALGAGGALFGNAVLRKPGLGVVLACAGLVPLVVVAVRKRRRMTRFEIGLPQALDLLSRALRAGHAMSAGLQMVGDELDDPVGPEFAQVAEEVQLGLELPQALANLRYRIDVPDVPFFVSALVIQRETGGNLAEVIDGLARVIRERLTTEGKIRALTAQSRWSANILLFAPFVFLGAMTLVRPDYVAPLWETRPGNLVLVAASSMAVIGWALCRRVGVVRV